MTSGTEITIKVEVEEGYQINRATIGARGSGAQLVTEDLALLTGETGYTYTIPSTGEYEFEIQFGVENSEGGGQPEQNSQGFLKFLCQSNKITGGSLYYKLGDADEFTKVSEEGET